DRRSDAVTMRNFLGTAAEEISHNRVAQVQFPGLSQIGHARERNDSSQRQRIDGVDRTPYRQLLSRTQPQRQVPAGGVAYGDDAVQIQATWNRNRSKMVRGACYIMKSSGPGATWISDPSVLHIPARQTCARECGANMPDVFQIVGGAPESAVDQDRHRMRAGAFGQP